MTTTIIPINELDVTKITLGKVKNVSNGSKSIFLLYDNAPFSIKLPQIRVPFNASDFNGNKKFKLTLSLDNQVDDVLAKLQHIDQYLIQLFSQAENCKTFFGKLLSQEVVDSKYKPIVKLPKDPKYAPTCSLPLHIMNNGKLSNQIFDNNSKLISVDKTEVSQVLHANIAVISLLDASMWLNTTNGFGVSFYVRQLKIIQLEFKEKDKFDGCML